MTQSGSAALESVAVLVADAETVDVRLVAVNDGGAWRQIHATVIVNSDDPAPNRAWRYRNAVFLEQRVAGRAAAGLLRGEAQALEGLKIHPPPAHTSGAFRRLEGHRKWGYLVTPFPRTEWEFNAVESPTTHPWQSDVLVGDGPPFVSFEAAFSAFLFGAPPGNHAGQRSLWRVIRLDRRAWLHRITIAADSMTVMVKGTETIGTRLELSTPTAHAVRPVGRQGKIRLRLPTGLANHTLLVLRGDDDWLDLRHFSAPAPVRANDPSIVWDQPGADLEVLIASGEGTYVEFKEAVPTQSGPKKNMLKTVAAFASGEGGTILFGVDDEAQVVGVDAAVLDRLEVAIRSMIRDSIAPEPTYSLRVETLGDKTVLAAEIQAGGRWFALNPLKPEFYVRRGASTVPARMDEVTEGFARQALATTRRW